MSRNDKELASIFKDVRRALFVALCAVSWSLVAYTVQRVYGKFYSLKKG